MTWPVHTEIIKKHLIDSDAFYFAILEAAEHKAAIVGRTWQPQQTSFRKADPTQ